MRDGDDTSITVRVPASVKKRLSKKAAEAHRNLSQEARLAIEKHLAAKR